MIDEYFNFKEEIKMPKARKKPVVIEYVQWTGDNTEDVANLAKDIQIKKDLCLLYAREQLIIPTLEGDMRANKGDYIIKGVRGEIYPCKPDIFEATYEAVEE